MKRWISLMLSVAMLCTMCLSSVVVASAEAPAWDGTAATSFSGGGTGLAETPYKIGTAGELKLFANIVNGTELPAGFTQNSGACGILTADIELNTGDLSGYNGTDTNSWVEWTPIGTTSEMYAGTFDGDGHSVSGVYINDGETYSVGLFGAASGEGEIRNLGVINSYIKGNIYTGGVCGAAFCDITACYNAGTVIGTGTDDEEDPAAGGVCGAISSGGMTSCYNTGDVTGLYTVGGVCGYVDARSITFCYNTGKVTGNGDYAGGVCGFSGTVDMTDCYNSGEVSGVKYVGGLCGLAYADITSCYNTGTVSGVKYVGGLVGESQNKITACYNSGRITGTGNYVGGVCGDSNDIHSCYNTGMVGGPDKVGGVSGHAVGIQTNCYTLENTVTFSVSSNQSNDNSVSKSESEMKARAFVGELSNGETYFAYLPGNYPPLTWQMTNSYIVTIPAEVTLGGSATISAEVGYIPEGSSLNVTLSEKSDLSNGKSGTLAYDIRDSLSNVIEIGGTVLTVNPSTAAAGSATLYFSTPTNTIRFSGDYSGTVTFTVSVAG